MPQMQCWRRRRCTREGLRGADCRVRYVRFQKTAACTGRNACPGETLSISVSTVPAFEAGIDLANEFDHDIKGGLEMTRAYDHRDLIAAVASKNEVSVEVIERLIDLEGDFQNLHAYGARSNFRSRINAIIDVALQQARVADGR